jgi:hypothetical protein
MAALRVVIAIVFVAGFLAGDVLAQTAPTAQSTYN